MASSIKSSGSKASSIKSFGRKAASIKSAGRQSMNTSDPYVSVSLSGATVGQTRIIFNSAEKVVTGDEVNGWLTIIGHSGTDRNPELHGSLQFRPVGENPVYQHGVGTGPDYMRVPSTYFPLRKGGI
ncbi:hypothetical protein F3Y22_tig00002511pilonHSYRG00078 [Hibiscus syriacus]|uniref:Uncharacterized protein n=1 Tax=Hibiscus syriacus TaxID=106335 RepID=A0A6A3CQJ6_HIBSY|nr:hypothetical protein F3Y22_tig00002511pilonHSYRG00078 [Hibiscus syriacus]